jgi:hypothetical protein
MEIKGALKILERISFFPGAWCGNMNSNTSTPNET